MKILIVNTSDLEGGAARAAYRLHKALLDKGVDSNMLVQSKTSDDFTVLGPLTKFQKMLGKIRPTLDSVPVKHYTNRSQILFSPSWLPFSAVVKKINALNPDVVHLHWIAGGMIRIEDLDKIKASILWSLHDMWAFTGGCHYDQECAGYKNQCGACPILGSYKVKDLSRKVWLRKKSILTKLPNMKIIGLSNWLTNCASQSNLFRFHEVTCLPNVINTDIYAPFDKTNARQLFNLPLNKKLILFGAMGATSDIRKGYKELSQALQCLDSGYELIVFGASKPQNSQGFKQQVHYLGQVHDDISLRVLYSAADVMVVPSLQENLSNTIMESLSCGTPVVSFKVGGNIDLIEHKKNGYLVKKLDVQDLAKGIYWVLNLENTSYEKLSNNARNKVLRDFDSRVVAQKYIDLYKQVQDKIHIKNENLSE